MYVKTQHGLSLNGAWALQLRLYTGWIVGALAAFLFIGENLSQFPQVLLSIYLVSGIAVILHVLIAKRENFHFVPRIRITLRTMLLALLMGLSMFMLKDALARWLPFPRWPEVAFTAVNTSTVYSIIGSVMLSAFMEEILFRGIIMEALLKRYTGSVALLQSSLLFMLAHPDPSQMPGAFLLGLLTGYFYLRQRDLCMCYFIHITNNVAAAVMMLNGPLLFTSMEPYYYYSILGVGVAVLFTGYFLMRKFVYTTQP